MFFAVARCPDGGVVAVGVTDAASGVRGDGLVCKFELDGTLRWVLVYDYGEGREGLLSHVAVGRRAYLVWWSAAGARRWACLYPAAPGDEAEYRAVLADKSGGAYVAGNIDFSATGDINSVVRHIGSGGRALWTGTSLHVGGDDAVNGLAFSGGNGVCAVGRYMDAPGDEEAIIEKRLK